MLIDGKLAKASRKLRSGENISILGDPQPPPLRAMAEAIPLEIVYEDGDLAVVNKPAGMMVHAGSGATEDARNRGTLVNALLHHLQELSSTSGPLRPGIVHRLDKQTSGLIVVAKNDATHARLSSMFARRQVRKLYIALVQGELAQERGTVNASISRDSIRRTRMTTRREGGRTAVSHWQVLRRIHGPYGSFTLVSVRIETRRTIKSASTWPRLVTPWWVTRCTAPQLPLRPWGRLRAGCHGSSYHAISSTPPSSNLPIPVAGSPSAWFPIYPPT